MNVTLAQQPELRVSGIRHIGPYPEIGKAFSRLGGLLKGQPPKDTRMIAVFHDDPAVTPANQLRSDAAITLPGHTPSPMGLIEHRVPAGLYALAVHHGSYAGLPAAWAALKEWALQNGRKPSYPGYEIYLNTPMDTKEADLRTEIYMRVE